MALAFHWRFHEHPVYRRLQGEQPSPDRRRPTSSLDAERIAEAILKLSDGVVSLAKPGEGFLGNVATVQVGVTIWFRQ